MPPILAYLATSLLYAVVALHQWRKKQNLAAAGGGTLPVASSWDSHAILAPLAVHTYSLYSTVFAGPGLALGVGSAISAILWLTVLVYWVGNFFYRLEALQALVAPVASVASLAPALLPVTRPLPNTDLPAFKVHLLIALLSYSLFTIATLHAALMSLAERRLHSATAPAIFANLPPLLTLEQMLFRIITAGFVLLTLTVVTGIAFSEELFGKPLQLNHKNVFALISWAIYGALLSGRKIYGWRGRVAVRWTLAGFVALLLAYVGTKFVLEVILGRY